jgi:hypothetical protein
VNSVLENPQDMVVTKEKLNGISSIRIQTIMPLVGPHVTNSKKYDLFAGDDLDMFVFMFND